MTDEAPASSPRPRQVRGQQLTELVLNATRQAISRHGYAGLSIDSLADELGIAKTSIYRRWPTKVALVSAAADQAAVPDVAPPDTGNLREDLLGLVQRSFDLVVGPDKFYESLIRAAAADPDLATPVQRLTHRRRSEYRLVINRAIGRGEVPVDTDIDTVFDHLYGPLWFRILVSGRSAVELEPEDLVAVTLRAVGWESSQAQ